MIVKLKIHNKEKGHMKIYLAGSVGKVELKQMQKEENILLELFYYIKIKLNQIVIKRNVK